MIACNANPARGHDQEFSALKLLFVCCKHGIEVFNLCLEARTWHPEEDDTFMGELLVIDQLAKIPVSNNQYPFLLPRDSQNVIIRKAMRIIAGDSNDIVFVLLKM